MGLEAANGRCDMNPHDSPSSAEALSPYPPSVTAPYPGLRSFERDESFLFFGREAQIDDVLERLKSHHFLAVVGSSGCGKSSLVRAGVLPALESGLMGELGSTWLIAEMKPGSAPMAGLAKGLLQSSILEDRWKNSEEGAAFLTAALRRSDVSLFNLIQELHPAPFTNLLILVDQFEEIFRFQQKNPEEAMAFVNLLLRTVEDRSLRVFVMLTMRSDFLGPCAVFPGLPEALNDSQYLCPRLSRAQLGEAIGRPAELFRGRVEPALITRIINDSEAGSDQLPLIQHLLARMWRKTTESAGTAAERPQRRLTVNKYIEVGGLPGGVANEEADPDGRDRPDGFLIVPPSCLTQHANDVYKSLSDGSDSPESPLDPRLSQRQIARKLFQCLATRGVSGQYVRRPVKVGEVAAVAGCSVEQVIAVTAPFRHPDCSFLLPPLSEAINAESDIDISHESLIRHWDLFITWLEEEEKDAEELQQIGRRAEKHHTEDGDLLDEMDLRHAEEWRARVSPHWAERYFSPTRSGEKADAAWKRICRFIDCSRSEIERRRKAEEERTAAEEKARRNRIRYLITGMSLAVVLAAAFLFLWRRAENAQQRAETERATSLYNRIGVQETSVSSPDERSALIELATLGPSDRRIRESLLEKWLQSPEQARRGIVRQAKGFRAATGLDIQLRSKFRDEALRTARKVLHDRSETVDSTSDSRTAFESPLDRILFARDVLAELDPEAAGQLAHECVAPLVDEIKTMRHGGMSNEHFAIDATIRRLLSLLAPADKEAIVEAISIQIENAYVSSKPTSLRTLQIVLPALDPPQRSLRSARAAKSLVKSLATSRGYWSLNGDEASHAIVTLCKELNGEDAGEVAAMLVASCRTARPHEYHALPLLDVLLRQVLPKASQDRLQACAQELGSILEEESDSKTYRLNFIRQTAAILATRLDPAQATELARRLVPRITSPKTSVDDVACLAHVVSVLAPHVAADQSRIIAESILGSLDKPAEMDQNRLRVASGVLPGLVLRLSTADADRVARRFSQLVESVQGEKNHGDLFLRRTLAAMSPALSHEGFTEISPANIESLLARYRQDDLEDAEDVALVDNALSDLLIRTPPAECQKIADRMLEVIRESQDASVADKLTSAVEVVVVASGRLAPEAGLTIAGSLVRLANGHAENESKSRCLQGSVKISTALNLSNEETTRLAGEQAKALAELLEKALAQKDPSPETFGGFGSFGSVSPVDILFAQIDNQFALLAPRLSDEAAEALFTSLLGVLINQRQRAATRSRSIRASLVPLVTRLNRATAESAVLRIADELEKSPVLETVNSKDSGNDAQNPPEGDGSDPDAGAMPQSLSKAENDRFKKDVVVVDVEYLAALSGLADSLLERLELLKTPQSASRYARSLSGLISLPQYDSPEWLALLDNSLLRFCERLSSQEASATAALIIDLIRTNSSTAGGSPQNLTATQVQSLSLGIDSLSQRMNLDDRFKSGKHAVNALDSVKGLPDHVVNTLRDSIVRFSEGLKPGQVAFLAKPLVSAMVDTRLLNAEQYAQCGGRVAALCERLPSARRTHRNAVMAILVLNSRLSERSGSVEMADSLVRPVKAWCEVANPPELLGLLQFPFCTGEAESVVLDSLQAHAAKVGIPWEQGAGVWTASVKRAVLSQDAEIPSPAPASLEELWNELDGIIQSEGGKLGKLH